MFRVDSEETGHDRVRKGIFAKEGKKNVVFEGG